MKTKKVELSNKNKLVMNYFDKRAEVYGLRETKGVFLFQCSFDDDNEDEDDYTFRTAFFTHQDKNGNLYILPRQIDFEYDIEQYRDPFKDEYVDFLVKWFRAQRKMNENFTYYCDDIYDLLDNVYERENALTEEFKAGYAGSMMRVLAAVTE